MSTISAQLQFLYGSEDSAGQNVLPLTPDNDCDYVPYVASNAAPRLVRTAPIVVEAPDLREEAEAIMRTARTQQAAGFQLVAVAKRHGFSASEAFQCAREALRLCWAATRPAKGTTTSPVVPIVRERGRFPVSLGDWRGQARRKASNRRNLLRSVRRADGVTVPVRN